MEIRFFRLDETEQLQKGINDIWGSNHVFSRNENLLRFMFHENPSRVLLVDHNHYSFLGAWENNVLIGFLGVLPFVFNNQGKKDMGCCLTNWIVSPEYRSTGAGLSLLNEIQNFNPSIVLSLGINEHVAKLYRMMRWNVLDDCPRWIGILNKDKVVTKLLGGDLKPLRYWNVVKKVIESSLYEVTADQTLDEELWDQYYWGEFAKNSVGFARDFSFIQWRYLKNPFYEYKLLICKDRNGKYKGLAIIRIETILGDEKIGRVVEFITSDQDSAIALANAIIEIDKDLLFIDFYCFSSVSSWGLEAVGFKRFYQSDQDTLVVPSRFQPLDLQVTSLKASMFINKKFKKQMNLIQDDLWYVTKGDSDQDRPN